jgi:hypothetical protein
VSKIQCYDAVAALIPGSEQTNSVSKAAGKPNVKEGVRRLWVVTWVLGDFVCKNYTKHAFRVQFLPLHEQHQGIMVLKAA